jgi:hypothetical protein
MLTPALALVVAVAGLVAIKLTGATLPGRAIRHTELTAGIGLSAPRVGDTVMFLIGTLDIAPGTTIKVVRIASAGATGDLRVIGGRVYQKKDSDNVVPLGSQPDRDGRYEIYALPSTPLVGSRLTADPTEQRYILLEYLVCAPGDATVDTVDVTYSVGAFLLEQTLQVDFRVTDAQASTEHC